MNYTMKQRKARKGFSLVELVVVILIIAILAVAVFAGGSAVIKKSQVSRTTSDLHNFSVAVESTLNEHPEVANISAVADFGKVITALNKNLPADYQLDTTAVTNSGDNANFVAAADALGSPTPYAQVYKSAKKDAWDNYYYVVLDLSDRNAGKSEFYITVVSAGPNAKATIGGAIGADDVFLLAEYSDGDVVAKTYNAADTPVVSPATAPTIAGGSVYSGTAASKNF